MARPVTHHIVIGTVFGWLVTLQRPVSDGHDRRVLVHCRCGVKKMVSIHGLLNGRIRSCGCWHRQSMTTHGQTDTRLYRVWVGMIQRCTNPRATGFKNYGGRGIKVCCAWQVFRKFAEWALSHGYADVLMIDRKKTDGNYQPSNCRFVERRPQAQSHRKRVNSQTPYIGVSQDKRTGKWLVYGQGCNGKSCYLGSFRDSFSAAWVRDTYVWRHYDRFVTLNNLCDRRKVLENVHTERRGTFDWNVVLNKWHKSHN